MFCNRDIIMTEKLGRWYPSDLDGGTHYCEAKKQHQHLSKQEQEPELKNLLEAQVLLQGMDARLKRLEKMLFIEGTN